MSKLKQLYKAPAPSRLVKVFEAGADWEQDIYCKPCPKKSYAFWIAELTQYENLQQHEVREVLSGFVDMMAKLSVLCACNENGESIFDYETDVEVLSNLDDSSVLDNLFRGACSACGIDSLADQFLNAFNDIDQAFDDISDALSDSQKPKSTAKKKGAGKTTRKKR
jgi:hypothetical protein